MHKQAQERNRRARKQAKDFGWTEPFEELPTRTQKLFVSGKATGIPSVSDRKGFSKDRRFKSRAYRFYHLPLRMLRQRAELRADWNEAEVQPPTNKLQREIGRFTKRPKKRLMARG